MHFLTAMFYLFLSLGVVLGYIEIFTFNINSIGSIEWV